MQPAVTEVKAAVISGVSRWRCKCGVSIKVLTETERARIDKDIRNEVACPKCGERQVIYAHRVSSITIEKADPVSPGDRS